MNMASTFADSFAAARPVAQHCPELTWRGPRPEERAEAISAWCRDLAQDLAQELGQVLSGGKLHISVSEPQIQTGAQVFETIGPVAVNSLLRCGAGDATVLLSLDYATAIALTDCSFGGEGHPPDQVPSQLPRSAAMLVEQFASTIAQVIALAGGSPQPVRGDVLVRSESVTRLKPFGAQAEVALFRVTMAMGAFAEWTLLLAVQNDRLDALLPGTTPARAAAARSRQTGDAQGGPFAVLPMRLEAVLGEVELPLARLGTLAPGDELALTIPRELALRIGEDVFAHGTPGTLENRMALRLTRVPHRNPASVEQEPGQ
jgi:flagellar motor switch protein FliM